MSKLIRHIHKLIDLAPHIETVDFSNVQFLMSAKEVFQDSSISVHEEYEFFELPMCEEYEIYRYFLTKTKNSTGGWMLCRVKK